MESIIFKPVAEVDKADVLHEAIRILRSKYQDTDEGALSQAIEGARDSINRGMPRTLKGLSYTEEAQALADNTYIEVIEKRKETLTKEKATIMNLIDSNARSPGLPSYMKLCDRYEDALKRSNRIAGELAALGAYKRLPKSAPIPPGSAGSGSSRSGTSA